MATASVAREGTARRRAVVSGRPRMLPGPGPFWARMLLAVIGFGTLPLLWVWWADTSAGSLRSTGDYLAATGRLSGLLGAYLLLVLVALMARVPWVDTRVGPEVTARFHRALGEYTVTLLSAHAVLIVVGYATQSGTGVVTQAYTVAVSYPDVMMAIAALGLLIMVGVMSARRVRRRMMYETWYFMHLYVYLAMGLAFAHEFAVGADFSASARNRLLWSAAHIAVFATLILFRLVVPIVRSARHRVRVANVVAEGPGVISVYLTGRNLDRLGCAPGQFLRWRFLTRGLWWESHPYSLSAPPSGTMLRITVKSLGDGTRRLQRLLRPGTAVWFEGPYGTFTADRGRPRAGGRHRALLIAAGAGITPIRALYETLPGGPGDVVLVYRASRPRDLVFWRELESIARRRGFGLYPVTGSRADHRGDPLTARDLLRAVPDTAHRDVYLCGPPGFVAGATAELREAGVPRRRIHAEAFEL
jgi:predicted ferric reductase